MTKRMTGALVLMGSLALMNLGGAHAAEDKAWERGLSLGFSLTSGNSDTITLNLGADANKKWGDNEFLSLAKFRYGESENDKTTENVNAKAQYNFLLSERLYTFLTTSFLYDDIALVDYRVLVGPGFGYYLLKGEPQSLGVEFGFSYLTERVDDVIDQTVAFRLAERYETSFSESGKLYQYVEYLPQIDDVSAYLLNAGVGAEAALNGSLSLKVALDDRYDSTPAAGQQANDLFLNAGVALRM